MSPFPLPGRPLGYAPPIISLGDRDARRRSPRTEPVDPPAGYRWHLDTEGLKWVRPSGRRSIGDLELIGENTRVGDLGLLWDDEPVPGKKRKTRPRPTFARVSDRLYSANAMRRVSRRLIRQHEALLAQELELTRQQHLAAAAIANLPTGPTPPGGVSQPRRYKPDRWGQPGGPDFAPAHPPRGGSGVSR